MASKKPETVFKERVQKDLFTMFGDSCWVEKIQQVAIRGTPDLLICICGDFIAFELKKDEDSEPDRLQTHKLMAITKAGGKAYTVHPGNWKLIKEKLLKKYG